jgi:signal transduction histidine kinase/DNA-binding NarL/FixJ family response regulator
MQKDEEVAAVQRKGIRAVYWEVLWCFLGMVASAMILVVLLFWAIRNVSSLLRVAHAAEAAAAQASQAKSQFLAAMSHEIRTPLTGVLGMADLLAAAELPDKERRHADAIRTSGRHLLNVINDILDFSRIEAGKLELERVDFSVPEVMESVRSLMAPQAAERGLELTFALDQRSPPVVQGDPTRLRQVLLNLVGNALKFTPAGGVAVRTEPRLVNESGVHLRFEVADTGIGIPRERQAELFESFTQADRSTTRHYGGSGLGLAICKRLVLAMGGTIGVASVPERGSTFWFEVPFARGDVAAAAKRSAFEPASIRPLRVLVVDDVAVNRELLEEMLARHGHKVLLAEDGAAALQLAARERPDVVLMDVQMPVMDGMEATRRIRQLPPPAGAVPILALTANVLAAERERYLACGMDLCLTKPVVWPDLFAALAEATSPSGIPIARAQVTKPQAAAQLTVQGSEPPLLDGSAAGILNDEKLAGLLKRVIVDAERACERCRTLPAASKELLREVHALKGTAGLFGLRRISAAAADVQAAAGDEQATSESAERLAAAVAATREALKNAELI